MTFQVSNHVRTAAEERDIPWALVESVLQAPEQIVAGHGNKQVYQSRVETKGRVILLRVIVATDVDPPLVVTVYRTSKVAKYWRPL